MTSRCQFALVFASVIALGAVVSHAAAKWAGIDTHQGSNVEFGQGIAGSPALLAGSSMIGVAIDWNLVAADLSRPIVEASTASASPCELEQLSQSVPDANLTFVGVSIYELDEYFMADFRADIVPISRTFDDLWQTHSDWPFCKRTLSRYPLSWLQCLFPSAGRSMGIMVGLRTRLSRLAGHAEADPLPQLHTGSNVPTVRVTDWPEGRLLRNLSELRAGCRGQHGFDGPKHLAFDRMLDRLARQGKTIVIVLPVSPQYQNGLLKPSDIQAFDHSLQQTMQRQPQVKWVRYDQLAALQTPDDFSDLMHLNLYGRRMVMDDFRARLKKLIATP